MSRLCGCSVESIEFSLLLLLDTDTASKMFKIDKKYSLFEEYKPELSFNESVISISLKAFKYCGVVLKYP
jgi:hypothetical protein